MRTISASQLKLFALCPRSWYLKHVLRAPDDAGAGGLYLGRGNDFDRLVQLYVRDGVVGDSGAPKLANRQLAQTRQYLPRPASGWEVQFSYSVDAGGFRVNGKPDLRLPGFIQDTKTTSDRGPGQGAASDRPAYALTDPATPGGNLRPLAEDVQARLYAWCEFQLDPVLAYVECRWIYVSKADCPKSWVAECVLERADVVEWFDDVVRGQVAEMDAYAAAQLTADRVPANPESCRRCFVRAACPGPFEGVNVYGLSSPQKRENHMAFDLKKLQNKTAPAAAPAPAAPSLEETLAASVAAVTTAPAPSINRPRVDPVNGRPLVPASEALSIREMTGSANALSQLEIVDTEGEEVAPSVATSTHGEVERGRIEAGRVTPPHASQEEEDAVRAVADALHAQEAQPAPKAPDPASRRGRGRPRKPAATVAEPSAAVSDDPKAPARAPSASGCASSVGDLAAAVSALISAVRSLECAGKTGVYLQDAEEALRGGAS
jgi:cytochrome c553